jgi:DNA-binding SARP family transcriptional activator
MEFRLLGTLEVVDGDRRVEIGGQKPRQLLGLLLVNANQVVSVDRLIDELWGEHPPETAANTLQVYVSKLRKSLSSAALVTQPPGYVLQVDVEHVDARRFERLVREGRAALARGDARRASALLEDALALWRGPALAEFAFQRFAQAEIARLDELRLVALEERAEAELALGRHAELAGELEGLVAANPLRERLRGQLILALYRSGRQAEALAAYRTGRAALVDELGIEPSPELQRLERAILVQDPALDAPRAAPERGRAAVLFADLGIGESVDAEDALAAAIAEIEAAGVTPERGIADAVLARFGGASDAESVERAITSAVRLLDRLEQAFGDRLRPRMAVELGEVVVDASDHTTGPPVAAAARLIRDAAPGDIVVGVGAAAGASRLDTSPRVRVADA